MSKTTFTVLSTKTDWSKFFSLVKHVGPTLNDRKSRFDKSDILEQALDVYSDAVTWVDEVGHDHVVEGVIDPLLEMKTQINCIFTPLGTLKKFCSVKLMNSLGDASKRSINDVIKFNNLLLVDTGNEKSFSAAIVSKQDIKEEWLDFEKDGETIKIPTEHLKFVTRPDQNTIYELKNNFSYLAKKRQMMREFIELF